MNSSVYLRTLKREDLSQISKLHQAAFPESYLTALGTGATERYYEWLLSGPHQATAVGAFEKERLLGFCFGGIFRGATTGFIKRNKLFLAGEFLKRIFLIFKPRFLMKIFQIIKGMGPGEKPRLSAEKAKSFGILSVAVDPRFQMKGIGKKLMDYAEDRAHSQDFSEMNLTVHADNLKAICFYEKMGWKKIQEGKKWGGSMKKSL